MLRNANRGPSWPIFPRCKFSSFETLVLNGWCDIMSNFIGKSLGRNRPSTCQKLQSWVAEEALRHYIALGILSYVTCRWHAVWRVQDLFYSSNHLNAHHEPWLHVSHQFYGRAVSQFQSSVWVSSSSYTYGRLVWTLQNLTGMVRQNIGTASLAALSNRIILEFMSKVALACSGVWPGKSHAQSFAIPNKDFTVPTWQVAGNILY